MQISDYIVKYHSVSDVAKILNVCDITVYKMISRKRLAYHKVANRIFIEVRDIAKSKSTAELPQVYPEVTTPKVKELADAAKGILYRRQGSSTGYIEEDIAQARALIDQIDPIIGEILRACYGDPKRINTYLGLAYYASRAAYHCAHVIHVKSIVHWPRMSKMKPIAPTLENACYLHKGLRINNTRLTLGEDRVYLLPSETGVNYLNAARLYRCLKQLKQKTPE
jgi:hypothetical protein